MRLGVLGGKQPVGVDQHDVGLRVDGIERMETVEHAVHESFEANRALAASGDEQTGPLHLEAAGPIAFPVVPGAGL